MPSVTTRMEDLKAISARYRQATKETKGGILVEFCKVCHDNRTYAIRLLNGPAPEPLLWRSRKRPFRYGIEALQVAEAIWKAAGYLCGQRLTAAIPVWLSAARRRFRCSADVERPWRSISARPLDNRLRDKKRDLQRRIYGTTRPGSFLKHLIPIRTSNWDLRRPGYLELDLVAHCGNSTEGQFLYTLDATDIQTGWTERRAVLGRGQTGIGEARHPITHVLPFALRGIDSDNGEALINYQLLRWCRIFHPAIAFTRGRATRKNDNAYVEQKNWTHVRQVFGWDRYETDEALHAMHRLYAQDLRLFQTLFPPSLKRLRQARVGSQVIRPYDPPKTALERVIATGQFHRANVKQLKAWRDSLDPFQRSEAIERQLAALARLASQRLRPSSGLTPNIACRPRSSWGSFIFSRKEKRLRRTMHRLIEQASPPQPTPSKGGQRSVTSSIA